MTRSTQDDACESCALCDPSYPTLNDHVSRKRGREFNARNDGRTNKCPKGWNQPPKGVKKLERRRSRARGRTVDMESAPKRDAAWMRWDIWSWT